MKHVRSAMAIAVAVTLSSGLASETIEEVIVTSSFVGQKISDIDNPLHVVDGDDLSTDATSSLGESLDNLLGVASADFGAATGQPIIRGMSGTRIGVLHNGMLNRDVSFLGADHPNDIDLSDIAQIEIVRGPSSLLYANGTIGGIINVVDNTIAREDFAESEFRFGVESQSVNDGEVGELSYRANMGGFNLSLSFKDSNLDNFDIPRGAIIHSEEEHHDEDHYDHEGEDHDEDHDDHEGEDHDEDHDEHEGEHDDHEGEEMSTLANSDFEAQAKRIGISKTGDWGYVGMSFSNNESVYGIPYHGEGHEGHERHGDEHEGERIFSVTDSDKFDIRGSFLLENGFLNRVDYSFRDSDYSLTEQHADGDGAHHSEEEHGDDHDGHDDHDGEGHDDGHHGEGPTTFKSESQEFGAVFDLSSDAFSQRFVVNYLDAENSIVGAESFMNPVFCKGMTFGYFLSREVGPFTMDVGIRHDRNERRGSLTRLNQHHDDHDDEEHDDEGHHDDHDDHEGEEHEDDHGIHDEHEGLAETDYFKTDFNNTSFALSLGRQLNDSLDLKLGFASVERAPSDAELFMNGPHLATGRFEVGNVAMDSEKSNNIDLTLNYESGNFFAGLTFFKNDVDSYIYLQDETGEEHEEHEEHHDDHGGLIRADYMQKDSEFEGYEFEVGTDIDLNTGTLSFLYGRDSVRGKFKDGTNIPRIVPARNMFSILYSGNDLKVKISLQDVEKQDDIAFNETSTSGHQLLDLKVTRSFQVGPKAEISVSLYGKNLLDEVARNHSSFVKDQVPLPGKNFGIRLSGKF